MTQRNAQNLRFQIHRGTPVRLVGKARLFQAERRQARRAIRHLDAAAQRDRRAAHGPRHHRVRRRPDDPLQPDARLHGAVGARLRPRRHRHAAAGGKACCASEGTSREAIGPRRIPAPHLGMEGQVRRRTSRNSIAAWAQSATGSASASPGRGPVARRARGVRAPVRKGPDLSRRRTWSTGRPACKTAVSATWKWSTAKKKPRSTTSSTPSPGRQPRPGKATSRWRRCARRRSWATPPWPCIPTTSATAT